MERGDEGGDMGRGTQRRGRDWTGRARGESHRARDFAAKAKSMTCANAGSCGTTANHLARGVITGIKHAITLPFLVPHLAAPSP